MPWEKESKQQQVEREHEEVYYIHPRQCHRAAVYVRAAILEADEASALEWCMLSYLPPSSQRSPRGRLRTEVAFWFLMHGRLSSCLPDLQDMVCEGCQVYDIWLTLQYPFTYRKLKIFKEKRVATHSSSAIETDRHWLMRDLWRPLTLWSFPRLFLCKVNTSVNGK